MFERLKERGFQIEFHNHAEAILRVDFPVAVEQLEAVLSEVSIPIAEIIASGGEAKNTQRLRRALKAFGWPTTTFTIEKRINEVPLESISHMIDHVQQFPTGTVALEIEWNNKDPFFDRDLENFKRLHAEGAISVGVIVTRGSSFQDRIEQLVRRYAATHQLVAIEDLARIGLAPTQRQRNDLLRSLRANPDFATAWAQKFLADKFGSATTHWDKLAVRIRRGVGNPCPLLLIGLPASIVSFPEEGSS